MAIFCVHTIFYAHLSCILVRLQVHVINFKGWIDSVLFFLSARKCCFANKINMIYSFWINIIVWPVVVAVKYACTHIIDHIFCSSMRIFSSDVPTVGLHMEKYTNLTTTKNDNRKIINAPKFSVSTFLWFSNISFFIDDLAFFFNQNRWWEWRFVTLLSNFSHLWQPN